MRVLIFGDSIAQGFFDTTGGWVQRLNSTFQTAALQNLEGDWVEIFNLGISGDTANGVVKRLPQETEARRLADDPIIIVIAIGLNDTVYRKEEEASSPELYKGELGQIISETRQYTDKIMFVGLTTVDDAMCNPWMYSASGKCWNNGRIWEFEQILREFCTENSLPHIPLYETFNHKQADTNLLADGLHPNENGHQLIAELVKPELDKLINDR